jgi:phosphate transport system permease protein/phosphate transport system substrate-binding protein
VGAPGNEGVASAVKQTPNAIGYVELAYALTTGMDFADVKNKAGKFVTPSLETTGAAVGQAAASLPKGDEPWTGVSLLDAPGDSSYPIASFSYLLVYKEMSTSIDSAAKARTLVDFIAWAVSPEGQKFAEKLGYVPLPDAVASLDMQTLALLTYGGKPVMEGQSSAQAAYGNQAYIVTGQSSSVKVVSASIDAGKSVRVALEGAGDVQLTLPKGMISGIAAVKAGGNDISFEEAGSTADSTTIRFTAPQDATVEITGAQVVPEFGVVASAALAASLAIGAALARKKWQLG